MSNRSRIFAFGAAAAFVVAGIIVAIFIGGLLGALATFVLIAGGLVLATSLVFLEVGLSEDRELEREYRRRLSSDPTAAARRRLRARRLGRERAHRRRLE